MIQIGNIFDIDGIPTLILDIKKSNTIIGKFLVKVLLGEQIRLCFYYTTTKRLILLNLDTYDSLSDFYSKQNQNSASYPAVLIF